MKSVVLKASCGINMDISVGEIAELVGGSVAGDSSERITGLGSIKAAQKGDLTFLSNVKNAALLNETKASGILVSDDLEDCGDKLLIRVPEPYRAFAKMLALYESQVLIHPKGIHPTAVIAESAKIGENVAVGANACIDENSAIGDDTVIYPGVYIGRDCSVGKNSVIYANVSIRERIKVGHRCILHSGVVLGSDGFGFLQHDGIRMKIPQVGTVEIGNDVEIGGNTVVDRATCDKTTIGDGTKIDNLVQIAHNLTIGKHCVISGQSGIAGSTTICDGVTIAAQTGIAGHLEVGENTIICAKAGVTKTVGPGKIVSGFPAIDHSDERQVKVSLRRLPQMAKRVRNLEQRIQELEDLLNGKTKNNS